MILQQVRLEHTIRLRRFQFAVTVGDSADYDFLQLSPSRRNRCRLLNKCDQFFTVNAPSCFMTYAMIRFHL